MLTACAVPYVLAAPVLLRVVAEFPKSGEESRSNSIGTTMHGSGDSVEGLVQD